jgi:hypothetical protein
MDIVQFRCSAGMGYSPFGGVPFEDDQPVRIALAPPASWSIAARRLFTATFAVTVGEETVLWFYACHAASREGVMEGLASRVPAAHLADAQVREGIDPTNGSCAASYPRERFSCWLRSATSVRAAGHLPEAVWSASWRARAEP